MQHGRGSTQKLSIYLFFLLLCSTWKELAKIFWNLIFIAESIKQFDFVWDITKEINDSFPSKFRFPTKTTKLNFWSESKIDVGEGLELVWLFWFLSFRTSSFFLIKFDIILGEMIESSLGLGTLKEGR
jgi:hypothetical protein